MSHISFFIITFLLIFTQSTYTMNEKDNKEENKISLQKSRQLLRTHINLSHTTTEKNNDHSHLPTITITPTNSTSTSECSSSSSTKHTSKHSERSSIKDSSKKNSKHQPTVTIATPVSTTTPDLCSISSTPSPTKKHSLKSSIPHLFVSSSHITKNNSIGEPKELPRSKSVDSYSSKKTDHETSKFFSKSDPIINTISSTIQTKTSPRSSCSNVNNIIKVVRHKDFHTIKEYLNNPDCDPNIQDENGMTALHYATIDAKKSKKNDIINLLLLNPRTDSTLINKKSETAFACIKGNEFFIKENDFLTEIRPILFARFTLDKTVSQETFIMLMNLYINKKKINDIYIKETVEIIKKTIETTDSQQDGDQELPQKAQLPPYATEEFIAKMILHRIPKDETTEHLISVIHKEIFTLLLNVEIDNIMIFNAVNTILDEITSSLKNSYEKSNAFRLPHYANYQFIFNVVEHYIKKEKIKIKPSFSEMLPQNQIIQSSNSNK